MKTSPEQKKALRQLTSAYKVAKNRWFFNKDQRTWKHALGWFGEVGEDKEITLKELDEYYSKRVEEIERRIGIPEQRDRTLPSNLAEQGGRSGSNSPENETNRDRIESQLREEKQDNKGVSRDIVTSYCPKFPDQTVELLDPKICKQEEAARNLFIGIEQNKTGQLLLAQTGAGKTYILGSLIKNFIEFGWIEKLGCISPWPILYVTKASVVDQTERVLREEFAIDTGRHVQVINIEVLRSKLGSLFIKEEVIIVGGQPHTVYIWNRYMHPCLIVWDECQILARTGASIQADIAAAFNDVGKLYGAKTTQIFSSATPFAKVSEAKCFAVSTGASFFSGKLTNENWNLFANDIAAPAGPEEYVEAAVNRLTDFLEPYIVRIKGVRPKHKAFNKTEVILFPNAEAKARYDAAWAKFQEEKAKYEGGENDSYVAVLAQLTIYSMAAELEKVPILVERALHKIENGKAPIIICRFKQTITGIVRTLIEGHGWTRDDISLIWGGSAESMTTKKKIALRINASDEFQEALADLGLTAKDLGVDLDNLRQKSQEQLDFERRYNLTSQKPDERDKERLRFQRQDSKLLAMTFSSGSVGLSAHHEARFPKALPRDVDMTPVYSEKLLVQGCGRAARITSISDTIQTMIYFKDTIEEHIAGRVVMKMKCLKQVTRAREDWNDLVIGYRLMKSGSRESNIIDAVDKFESGDSEIDNNLQEYGGE
jgi:hypothetical protein